MFKENLHTSVKILQICMDLQDSVQRSLQNPADLHRFAKIGNPGTLSDRVFDEKVLSTVFIGALEQAIA